MDDAIEWYETHSQDVRLIGYLVLTVVPGAFLADMLSRALYWGGLRVTLNELFAVFGRNSLTLAAFLFGLYLGFLVLLYIDFKKRAQSVILGAVTGLAVVVLAVNGRFLPNMDGVDLAFLFAGLLIGLVAAGGPKLHYLELNDARDLVRGRVITKSGRTPLEFRTAERYLYLMLVGVIGVGFVEAHVWYPPAISVTDGDVASPLLDTLTVQLVDTNLIAQDLAAVVLFSVALWLFLGYDTDSRLFILGPPGSGKTHVPIGMYLAANNTDLHVWGAKQGLTKLIREMRAEQDFANRTTPDDVQNIGFKYATTGYFPRNVTVDALDYPGEYLPHIPDGLRYLRDDIARDEFRHRIVRELESGEATKDTAPDREQGLADGGASQPPAGAPDQQTADLDAPDDSRAEFPEEGALNDDRTVDVEQAVDIRFENLTQEILPRVRSADTLLLMLDVERFERNERLYTNYYSEIMNELQVVEESPSARVKGFLGQETALGPLKAEKVVATKSDFALDEVDMSVTRVMGSYNTFRKRLYDVTQNDIEVGPLLNSLEDAPYPVFFKGKEEDRYQLEFGPDGSPIIFGFRELLERISR
jgi:hypothetical protein